MAMAKCNSITMKRFIVNRLITRYGIPLEIVFDRGSENLGDVLEIVKRLAIRRVVISPYNSRA